MDRKTITLAAMLAVGAAGAARADEWDLAAVGDDGVTSRNVLIHGSEQVHDLAAEGSTVDQDWYPVVVRPRSSYQMVLDGLTGDLRLAGADFQRLDSLGNVVLASAEVSDFGGTLSLAWVHTDTVPVAEFVRVLGPACGTSCTTDDRYRIRFYDTTYTIPRFNNSGTQATVTMVQNVTDRACDVLYAFLDSSGALAGSVTIIGLSPRAIDVRATAAVVPNRSGSIRITHTCGYGGLSGKAVSVEPATGFTFDTEMVERPH